MPEEQTEGGVGDGTANVGQAPASRRVRRSMVRRVLSAVGRGFRAWWRWRVTRVGVRVLAVLVVVALICDVAAAVHYRGLVQAKLAELKAAGYAVNYADVAPKPVPAAENAAPIYIKADDILTQRLQARQQAGESWNAPAQMYFLDADRSKPAVVAQMKRFFAANSDVLAMVDEASHKPGFLFDANWRTEPQPDPTILPKYSRMRDLTRFVCGAVEAAVATGDQAEALRRLRVGFVMCRHVLGQQSWLIGQIVAYAMYAMLDRVAVDVIGAGDLPADGARSLARSLEGTDFIGPYEQVMNRELAHAVWTYAEALRRSGHFSSRGPGPLMALPALGLLHSYLARPLVYGGELVFLDQMRKTVDASKRPWREARGPLVQVKRAASEAPFWVSLPSSTGDVFLKTEEKRDMCAAKQELLTTALALQVYKQEHGGVYPPTLAALKAALPWVNTTDVFSGKQFVYRRTGASFLLYSLGPDCRDDGGKPTRSQGGPLPATGDKEVDGVPFYNIGDILWLSESWYKRQLAHSAR